MMKMTGEIRLLFAVILVLSLLFFPVFLGISLGILFVISSAVNWEVKGGLYSSLGLSTLLLLLSLSQAFSLSYQVLAVVIISYFLVGFGLGKTIESMNRQRERLDSILQGTDVGTWEWNVETGELLVNERWAQILGFTLEELEPISIETMRRDMHPEDVRESIDLLERHCKREIVHYSFESRVKDREGQWIWVLDRGKVIQWAEDGRPLWMFGTRQDITEQKTREEELKQKSLVLDQIKDHVTITDLQGVITYVNQSNAEMFGVSKEEIIGKTTEVYGEDPEIGVSQREIIEETLKHGHWRGEVKNFDRDGNELFLDCRTQVIFDERERPIALCGIATNITQQKKIQEEVQKREERLRAIFEAAKNVAIIVTDAHPLHPRILEFSPGAEAIFGYEKEEVIGESVELLHRKEDVEQIPEMIKRMENDQGGFSGESILVRRWGEEFPVIFSTHPLFNSAGVMWGTLGVSIDITEQKELENALKEKEEKYRSIVDQTMEMIYLHTLDGSFIEVNRAAIEQTGYTKEELLSMNVFHLHQDQSDREAILSQWQEWPVGESVTVELKHKRKDGSIFPVEITAGKVFIGGKESILALTRDITERRQAEEEIEQAKNMLEVVIDSIPQFIFWKDKDSVYLGCNKIGARVAGLDSPEDIVGKTDYDLAWEREEADFYRMCDERVIRTGEAEFHIIEPQLQANGKQAWLDTNKVPLFDSDGEVVGILVTFEDITDRMKTEKELKEARQFLHSIIESIPDPIFVKDETHQWVILNKAMCQFLGYSKESLIGRRDFDVFSKEEAQVFWEKDRLVFETGQENINEEYITDSSGKEHYISTKKSLFTIEDGETYLIGVIRDITERKEAERKLTAYTHQIEDLYHQLEGELYKARRLHRHILPTSLPEIQGIGLVAYYQPAERIGGDFYGVIRVHNKVVIYLSDVSGHGLDSAMLSFFVKHTIKGFLSFGPTDGMTPSNILQYLFQQYRQENYPEEYFICTFMGVLDLETMEFKYSSAGFQDTPFVQMGDGEQCTLMSKGLFITSFFSKEMMNFAEESITLTPKTTIFFNTDGLTEEGVPGKFYRDRLSEVFYEHAHLPPHLISQAVVDDFREFNHGSLQGEDDITFLVLQMDPPNTLHHYLELASDYNEVQRVKEEVLQLLGDTETSYLLLTGLTEMVSNAIEHGNRLDSEKSVSVHLKVMERYIQASVEDEGEGFQWEERIHRPLDLEGHSDRGRGIAMTKLLCDGIFYNGVGNQVTLVLKH